MKYLGAPFSHISPVIRYARVKASVQIAEKLLGTIYSPILYGWSFEAVIGKHMPHEYWMRHCTQMLDAADEFLWVPLPGWNSSKGLAEEFVIWGRGCLREKPTPIDNWRDLVDHDTQVLLDRGEY